MYLPKPVAAGGESDSWQKRLGLTMSANIIFLKTTTMC